MSATRTGFRRVRIRDIPACARTLADAYGPDDEDARRRAARWTVAFYAILLWAMPHHYHRDYLVVVGVRRRSLANGLRTATAWAPYVIVILLIGWATTLTDSAVVATPARIALAAVGCALLLVLIAFRRNATRPRRSELAPRADWIVFDLGAHHDTRETGVLLDVRAFLRQHIAPEQTVGAVAHDDRTARTYEAMGLRRIKPGSLRMMGTLRR